MKVSCNKETRIHVQNSLLPLNEGFLLTGAFLVNTARGGLVDDDSLAAALLNKDESVQHLWKCMKMNHTIYSKVSLSTMVRP